MPNIFFQRFSKYIPKGSFLFLTFPERMPVPQETKKPLERLNITLAELEKLKQEIQSEVAKENAQTLFKKFKERLTGPITSPIQRRKTPEGEHIRRGEYEKEAEVKYYRAKEKGPKIYLHDTVDVLLLQALLSKLGFTDEKGKKLSLDGMWGDKTQQSLSAFQKAAGIKIDGEFGKATFDALKKFIEQGKTAPQWAQEKREPLLEPEAAQDREMPKEASPALKELEKAVSRLEKEWANLKSNDRIRELAGLLTKIENTHDSKLIEQAIEKACALRDDSLKFRASAGRQLAIADRYVGLIPESKELQTRLQDLYKNADNAVKRTEQLEKYLVEQLDALSPHELPRDMSPADVDKAALKKIDQLNKTGMNGRPAMHYMREGAIEDYITKRFNGEEKKLTPGEQRALYYLSYQQGYYVDLFQKEGQLVDTIKGFGAVETLLAGFSINNGEIHYTPMESTKNYQIELHPFGCTILVPKSNGDLENIQIYKSYGDRREIDKMIEKAEKS